MDCLLTCVMKLLCSLPLALGRNSDCLLQLACSCVVCHPPGHRCLPAPCSIHPVLWRHHWAFPCIPPLGIHCRGISWGAASLPHAEAVCSHVCRGPRAHALLSPARAAVLAGVTGGLAAPLVTAGAATIIGSAGAAALGSAAGIAIMTSLFGAAGAGLTGKAPEQQRS